MRRSISTTNAFSCEVAQSAATTSCERRGHVRTKAHARVASLASQHSLNGESSFLEQHRVTAATVQRCTNALNELLAFAKMSVNELKLLTKLDEIVVEMLEHLYFQIYGHGAGDFSMAAIKFVEWIQNFADFPPNNPVLR